MAIAGPPRTRPESVAGIWATLRVRGVELACIVHNVFRHAELVLPDALDDASREQIAAIRVGMQAAGIGAPDQRIAERFVDARAVWKVSAACGLNPPWQE